MRYKKRFNSSRSSRKGYNSHRRKKHATRLRSYGGSRGGIRL